MTNHNLICADCKKQDATVHCVIDPVSIYNEDSEISWIDLCDKCSDLRSKFYEKRIEKLINRRKEIEKARKRRDKKLKLENIK